MKKYLFGAALAAILFGVGCSSQQQNSTADQKPLLKKRKLMFLFRNWL